MKPKVSVIIPVYNEEKAIRNCLFSLTKQSRKDIEIILVDDGSTDTTTSEISNFKFQNSNLVLLRQDHMGPGAARNLGAREARGEILVFVDADMEFDKEFIRDLINPISKGSTIGTFSKEEYLLNKDNPYARCWNLNLGRRAEKMHPDAYPSSQPVFRAILKSRFDEAGGFDTNVGYTDDWTISRKLGKLADLAPGAKYYHRNPETLSEVWSQARWFGKNEFLTGNLVRKIFNLCRYFPPFSLIKGLIGTFKFGETDFLIFKIVYDTAVCVSILKSVFNEAKHK